MISSLQVLSMAVMFQAVYPTCLVNYMKVVSIVGLKFTFFGGSMVSGAVNSTSFSSDTPY